ncbi:hypothetical protein CAXC1_200005 [Candidatus Xenohaliotis californiensis]|uniref:PNPLA domain-containing protein n=1 Tax=Candidatus Xenohaliotis californiensis TaxID=84677 RepID=A0ABP0EVT1_9RICK|nr:hypothetical protein CAXC1_200005 [Candidatus Xenohaliotis californiensis]
MKKNLLFAQPPQISRVINSNPSNNVKKILVIAGGGVRCVISARLIQEIEKRCSANTSSLFDLIAGTSSGSIIGAALTSSDSINNAKDLMQVLRDSMPKIFGNSSENIFNAKFEHTQLEIAIDQFVSKKTLSKAKKSLVIPTFSLSNARPRIWSSDIAKQDITYDLLLKDIVSASCSAPTIFPPKKLTLNNGKEISEVDGGLWANNPTDLAFHEFLKIYPGTPESNINMVCVGTGIVSEDTIELKNYGITGWITKLIPLLSNTSTYWDGVSISNQVGTYHIAQPEIPENLNIIDDFKKVPELLEVAEKFIEDNDALFNDITKTLTN